MRARRVTARWMGSAMSIPTWLVFFGNSSAFFLIHEKLWMAPDEVMTDPMELAAVEEDVVMLDAEGVMRA